MNDTNSHKLKEACDAVDITQDEFKSALSGDFNKQKIENFLSVLAIYLCTTIAKHEK